MLIYKDFTMSFSMPFKRFSGVLKRSQVSGRSPKKYCCGFLSFDRCLLRDAVTELLWLARVILYTQYQTSSLKPRENPKTLKKQRAKP